MKRWKSPEEKARLKAQRTRRKAKRKALAQSRTRVIPEFYSSPEWKRVRYEALKRSHGRCECCGAGPAQGAVLNVDHINPRRKFPQMALDLDNLQVLCAACNQGKGNWDRTDWRSPEITADLEALADLRERGLLN